MNPEKIIQCGRMRHLVLVCTLLFFASQFSLAFAKAPEDFIRYQLRPKETLSSLVSRYLQGNDVLKEIAKFNGISNPNLVPAGYTLKIPKQFLRYQPSSATVSRLNCRSVSAADNAPDPAMKIGDVLSEGVTLRIPSGCQVTLLLEDASELRMLSGAAIQIKVLRKNELETAPEVRLELVDGRIEVEVPRKRKAEEAPFEVRTRNSLAGVRGTKFRVGFDANRLTSQVEVETGVVAALGSADLSEFRLNAGQGLFIDASGKARAIETLLEAPRYLAADNGVDAIGWKLKMEAPSSFGQLRVSQFGDATLAVPEAEDFLTKPEVTLAEVGSQAIFQQWTSVTDSGLIGKSVNYGFCKPFKQLEVWRCNVIFDLPTIGKPRLRLEKVDSNGQSTVLLNQEVKSALGERLVIRGLPQGSYLWQVEYNLSSERSTNMRGSFELIALISNP